MGRIGRWGAGIGLVCLGWLTVTAWPVAARVDDADLKQAAADVKRVFERHLEASRNEDVAGVTATLHPESPGFAGTKQMQERMFVAYDLEIQQERFAFLAMDEDYAYVRITMTFRDRPKPVKPGDETPPYVDNRSDLVEVFRKHEGQWRIWSSGLLSFAPLKPQAPANKLPADDKPAPATGKDAPKPAVKSP